MITNNEFLTLRAFQHKYTLTSAGVAIEIKRNNLYYFNNFGIPIEIYATRKDITDNTPIRYLWFPSYKYNLDYVNGETIAINNYEYTVVINNIFTTVVNEINLYSNESETERTLRTYSNLTIIRVFQLQSIPTEGNIEQTKLLEIKLPINTTPLPRPYLKSFELEMIDSDTARLYWKGTNPGDFYYYELWDSWNPITPLLKSRINMATGQYFHTFGAVTRGKYNIFTLKIIRDGIIYAERQIKILMPRDDFNIFSRMPRLAYTDSIFIIEEDPTGQKQNIKTPIAFVWFKSGNAWYTD